MTYEQFASMPMERFSFVGITEEYQTSLRLFNAIFGVDIPYHRTNITSSRVEASNQEREKVKHAQFENYSIYENARRRFDTLCRQFLSD